MTFYVSRPPSLFFFLILTGNPSSSLVLLNPPTSILLVLDLYLSSFLDHLFNLPLFRLTLFYILLVSLRFSLISVQYNDHLTVLLLGLREHRLRREFEARRYRTETCPVHKKGHPKDGGNHLEHFSKVTSTMGITKRQGTFV